MTSKLIWEIQTRREMWKLSHAATAVAAFPLPKHPSQEHFRDEGKAVIEIPICKLDLDLLYATREISTIARL